MKLTYLLMWLTGRILHCPIRPNSDKWVPLNNVRTLRGARRAVRTGEHLGIRVMFASAVPCPAGWFWTYDDFGIYIAKEHADQERRLMDALFSGIAADHGNPGNAEFGLDD